MGPLRIDPKTLELSKFSPNWVTDYNMIFIDQPIGTGYSDAAKGEERTNEKQIADDFWQLLVGFYEQNPEFRDRELYITGESFAGHYIPNIAQKIVRKMKNPGNSYVKLSGIAIGNGWTVPGLQYQENVRFAYENKLIDHQDFYLFNIDAKACDYLIYNRDPMVNFEFKQNFCSKIDDQVYSAAGGFDIYDIRNKETPDTRYIDNFLKQKSLMEYLGATHYGDRLVYPKLDDDENTDQIDKVEELLREGLFVLMYTGEKDYICNWFGGERWTNAVNWHHKEDFNKAPYVKQKDRDGKIIGEYKQVRNFKFFRIREAGHMVPSNQPEAAKFMIDQFIQQSRQNNSL